MKRLLLAFLVNLVLGAVTWGVGTFMYLTFPTDGLSVRPIATVMVAVIMAIIATILAWENNPKRAHVIGAMLFGAASATLVIVVGLGEGWATTGKVVGLVALALLWVGLLTLIEQRVLNGRWIPQRGHSA